MDNDKPRGEGVKAPRGVNARLPESWTITATAGWPARQEPRRVPAVAVVVAAYGVEKYIGECIESVQMQSTDDWELIVVDDGSPDESGRIADRYAATDPRIRVIHRENGGLSEARNMGLAAVTAPFVTILDGDDVLHPDYLAYLLSLQKGQRDRISCVGHFRFDDRDANPFDNGGGPYGEVRTLPQEEAQEEMLYQKGVDHSAWGKLYPRHAIPAGIYTPGTGYEDLDSFYRILPAVKEVVVASTRLYGYRRNPGSYLSVFTPRRADVLDVAERMECAMERNPRLLAAARSRLLSAYFNIYTLMAAARMRDASIERRCLDGIERLGDEVLHNRNTRLKNKAGIFIYQLCGAATIRLLARTQAWLAGLTKRR
jgi:putative glycosyltransferase